MESGDLHAVFRDGLIVVRDITLVDNVHMTPNEAVALAKWILENFDHKHVFDETFGVCECGAWENHFNCPECGAKTRAAYDGCDKCSGCGKPFEAKDVLLNSDNRKRPVKFQYSHKSAVAEKNGKFWGREQSDTQLPGGSGWVPIFAAYQVGEHAGQFLFEHYHAPKDAK
jgi:hypothetical protein